MVKRNDTCPCGSGLKYKRCCAALDREDDQRQRRMELNRYLADRYRILDTVPVSPADYMPED